VTVTGSASKVAQNDIAKVTFRVRTEARDAAAAVDRNAVRMRRVIAAIKRRGVAPADIRTDEVGLSRVRIKIRKHHYKHVYRAVNGVRVTVRHIQATGGVIDAAVHAGATSVGSIALASSNVDALYREALGDAFDDAHAKAQELADRAGETLGPAQTIDEGSQNVDTSYSVPQSAASGQVQTPIQPGTTTVSADVTVTFELG
jgi:uncharacterized protein YggE